MGASKAKRVYQVFLEYTNAHRQSGLDVLNEFSSRLFPGFVKQTVVIDNNLNGNLEIEFARFNDLIPGDNSTREFSGWDKGLAWAKRKYDIRDEDLVILANDTFHRSYGTAYLDLFDARVLAEVQSGAVVGYVDEFPDKIALFGLDLKFWIRSSLIIAKYGVLRNLLPMTIPAKNEAIFSGDWREFFSNDVPLSENYKKYLRTWLFGDEFADSPFKEAWHSQQKLSEQNLEMMKAKARCILCEHYFSARMLNQKVPMYNVCRQSRMQW